MKNFNLYKNFNAKRKDRKTSFLFLNYFINSFNNLLLKEKITLTFIFILGFVFSIQAQNSIVVLSNFKTIGEIVTGDHPSAAGFIGSFSIIGMVKSFIDYIVNVQINSVEYISATPMGGAGIFDKITSGLTIFAAIACFIKLLNHYLSTERFDNVKAYTGFFSYVSIFILFLFSNTIVKHVASLNSNINTNNITKVRNNLMNEIDKNILKDWLEMKDEYDALDAAITPDAALTSPMTTLGKVINRDTLEMRFTIRKMIFYIYMSIFSTILMSSLAIPTVIMTIMVKVTLSIMLLGAKLVFLLAFIPGFENVWKTYMMNLLNVLLWIPIFNVIISFILAFVSNTIISSSVDSGQIIWLSIITMIFAYQSISLTTTTANMIVSGAGSGIAGAMGSLSAMSATSVVAGGAAAAGGIAVMTASGGAAAPAVAGAVAGKFSK